MGYWHSLYSDEIHDAMVANNCNYGGLTMNIDATCQDLLNQFNELTSSVNVYDIFGICWGLGPYPQSTQNKHTYTAADYTPFL
jgi:hypothetical protein